uniref:hypothetical protein n=1 Tax=Vibrio vulnificus TaxID=672 RepID=UPI0019D47687
MLKRAQYNALDPKGKFKPNWEGPCVVKEIFEGRGSRIMDYDGNECSKPINLDRLKKYYM